MSDPHPTQAGLLEVHRLLDQAFAGIPMNPERQDLKEELRADLVAQVVELTADGVDPADAARTALAGLGDVRRLVEETTGPLTAGATGTTRGSAGAGHMEALIREHALHRVRPRPAFVVRAVLLGSLALAGLALAAVAIADDGVGRPARILAVLAVSVAVGTLVADALTQETTSAHPMPLLRAVGYGLGVEAGLLAVGLAWQYWPGEDLAWVAAAAVPLVACIALLAVLGATQTNRRKAWVMRLQAEQPVGTDRFSRHPEVAARFGIYTAAVWLVAIVGFVVLTATVGWAWSWTALAGGLAVMLLMLARMLFGAVDEA